MSDPLYLYQTDDCFVGNPETETHYIFPTPIGLGEFSEDKQREYKEAFNKAIEVDADGDKVINTESRHLVHSPCPKPIDGLSASKGIHENLRPCIDHLTAAVRRWGNDTFGWTQSNPEWFCASAWHNTTDKGGYQFIHNHCNSILTVTYYFDLDPLHETTTLWKEQYNTNPFFNSDIQTVTTSNLEYVSPNMQEGQYLIFPSQLKHSVRENIIDKPRRTLSLNFLPREIDYAHYRLKLG